QVHVNSRVFWIDSYSLLKVRNGFCILTCTKKLVPQAEEEHGIVRLLLQQLFQCLNAVFAHPILLLPGALTPCQRRHIVREVDPWHQPLFMEVDGTAPGRYVQRPRES